MQIKTEILFKPPGSEFVFKFGGNYFKLIILKGAIQIIKVKVYGNLKRICHLLKFNQLINLKKLTT